MELIFSEEIKKACPQLCVAFLETEVTNTPTCEPLWEQIEKAAAEFRENYTTETLKEKPSIAATRAAYRALGKDPSRYRPSNEALVRRVLQGKELYHINTIVDLNNLASIHWGYSIGGFDKDKIQGETLTLGVGKAGEPYEGIGRGPLNIEFLPVYRDNVGGIGTPTSDNERTKIDLDIHKLLFVINGYDGNREELAACAQELQELLCRYANSKGGEVKIYSCS